MGIQCEMSSKLEPVQLLDICNILGSIKSNSARFGGWVDSQLNVRFTLVAFESRVKIERIC